MPALYYVGLQTNVPHVINGRGYAITSLFAIDGRNINNIMWFDAIG